MGGGMIEECFFSRISGTNLLPSPHIEKQVFEDAKRPGPHLVGLPRNRLRLQRPHQGIMDEVFGRCLVQGQALRIGKQFRVQLRQVALVRHVGFNLPSTQSSPNVPETEIPTTSNLLLGVALRQEGSQAVDRTQLARQIACRTVFLDPVVAMADSPKWRDVRAPSLEDIEQLAAEAWEALPAHFREMCSDVVVRVEEFATDEVLQQLGIDSPFDLMGLYHGVSLDKRSFSDLPQQPDMVFLYRRALLDYWADSDETLGDIVTHVLVHEIGHHFGFSDEDMERIEAAAKF